MSEKSLEETSSTHVRILQVGILFVTLGLLEGLSYPIQVQPVHLGFVGILGVVLAEVYLVISRRSLLGERAEKRVNEILVALAETPFGWPVRMLMRVAEKRNEHIRIRTLEIRAESLIRDVIRIIDEEFGRADWLIEDYDAEELAAEVVSRTEQLGPFAVKDVIVPNLVDLPADERTAVSVLTIIRLQQPSDDVYQHKEAISRCLENFDFVNPSEAERKLLRGYSDLKRIQIAGETDDQTVSLVPEVNDPEQLYEEMMDGHYPFGKSHSAYNKTTLREYKHNIAQLVQSQLSIGGTQSRVLEAVKEERERLRHEIGGRDTYLVAYRIVDWDRGTTYDDVNQTLARKFDDHIKIGKTYTLNTDGQPDEDVKVNMWFVSVDSTYPSGEAFFHAEIEPLLPEEVVCYVAHVSTPLVPEYDRDELYEFAGDQQLVDEILTQADILFTGKEEDEITLQAIENMVEEDIDAEDLLSAIQLDSVSDATPEENRVFAEHREEIEASLGIDSVFQWGDVEPPEAGEVIDGIVSTGSEERWTDLSASLIETVQDCRPPRQLQHA